MTLPVAFDTLVQIGQILFFVGVFGLLLFFVRFLNKRRRRLRGEEVRSRGCIAGLVQLLVLLLLTVSGALLLTLSALQKTYKAFTDRQLVAQIYAKPLVGQKQKISVTLKPIDTNNAAMASEYIISGDEWAIEGNILTWSDPLTVYGLRPGYLLTRLRGRYLSAEQETTLRPTVYALEDEARNWRWQFLLRFAPQLPFVRAVYGQTVYTFPNDKKIFNLRVGHDGFTLEMEEYVPEKEP